MVLIKMDQIPPETILDSDIFPHMNGGMPLLRKGAKVSKEYLDNLISRGVEGIYTSVNSSLVRKLAEERDFVKRANPPITNELKGKAIGSLSDLFSAAAGSEVHDSARVVGEVEAVVDQLVTSIGSDRGTLVNISNLKSYDEYTYHHSLSVAVLSIAIGQYIGLDYRELNELGKCAMMHDIGKRAVPIEIIHKTSRLNDEEFTTIKGHSPLGYNYLLKENIGDEKLRKGVLCHHEKIDGTGYPHHLKGNEIPLWAKVISVADVYDALTSNRPYRQPMQPSEAIEFVMGGVGSAFDFDIVSAFVEKVELYPAGSYIELSDGRTALVLNTKNNMRPVVRFTDNGKTGDLYYDREFLSVVINRIIPEGEIPVYCR